MYGKKDERSYMSGLRGSFAAHLGISEDTKSAGTPILLPFPPTCPCIYFQLHIHEKKKEGKTKEKRKDITKEMADLGF